MLWVRDYHGDLCTMLWINLPWASISFTPSSFVSSWGFYTYVLWQLINLCWMYEMGFSSIQLWDICNVLVPFIILAQFLGPRGPLVLPLLVFIVANGHLEDPASCKGSPEEFGLLKLIIRRIQSLANNHLEGSATCKWTSGGSRLLQMIIQRIWPLANDYLEDLASCKWSSRGSGLMQMIIWRDWPLTNDHPSPPSP